MPPDVLGVYSTKWSLSCMTLIAVNGHDYSGDALKDAITAAAADKSQSVELLVK